MITSVAPEKNSFPSSSFYFRIERHVFLKLCETCSMAAIITYFALKNHKNIDSAIAFPSISLLAEETNISRQSISKSLVELDQKKFIAIKKSQKTNKTYYLFLKQDPPAQKIIPDEPEDPASLFGEFTSPFFDNSNKKSSDEEIIDHYAATLEDPPKPPRSKSSGRSKKKAEQEAGSKAEQSPKPPKPPKGPITIVNPPEEDPDYDILNDDSFDF